MFCLSLYHTQPCVFRVRQTISWKISAFGHFLKVQTNNWRSDIAKNSCSQISSRKLKELKHSARKQQGGSWFTRESWANKAVAESSNTLKDARPSEHFASDENWRKICRKIKKLSGRRYRLRLGCKNISTGSHEGTLFWKVVAYSLFLIFFKHREI